MPLLRVAVRACLKRSPSGCELPHHQADHGDADPRLSGFRQVLEVFTQPSRAMKPAACVFDAAAPLQDLKTLGVPGAFHDPRVSRSTVATHATSLPAYPPSA